MRVCCGGAVAALRLRAAAAPRRHALAAAVLPPPLCRRFTTAALAPTPQRPSRRRVGAAAAAASQPRHYAAAASAPLLCDDGLPLDDVDAVIVLAGGLTAEGGLPRWVELRLDAAAAVHAALGVPILSSGGGTPHRAPVLGGGGYVRHEGTVCAEYLIRTHAIPASSLLKECGSYDTLGNAWFSLTEHALPAGWRAPLVVTSAFHMARSRAAFEWVFSLPPRENGTLVRPVAPRFLSTPDTGLAPAVVAARAAREAESLAALRSNAARVTSMRDFHAWLYGTHMCYAVGRQDEWGANAPAMPDKALASY